jgi:hypothetical protein
MHRDAILAETRRETADGSTTVRRAAGLSVGPPGSLCKQALASLFDLTTFKLRYTAHGTSAICLKVSMAS